MDNKHTILSNKLHNFLLRTFRVPVDSVADAALPLRREQWNTRFSSMYRTVY
jgi:hypothetical protein